MLLDLMFVVSIAVVIILVIMYLYKVFKVKQQRETFASYLRYHGKLQRKEDAVDYLL